MSESAGVAITTVTSILIITCVVGNSLVCAVIMRNRDMRIPINYLLVNLAVADIIYSTFLIPELISTHSPTHPDGVTGRVLCLLLTNGNLAWVGAASSIFTLAVIATERYFAVRYPYGNNGKLTTRKLQVIIPISWIFSSILVVPKLLITERKEKKTDHKFCKHVWPEQWMSDAYASTWRVYIGLCFILLVGLYSRVVYALWIKRDDGNELTHQQQGVLKVRKRVTLMVVIVSIIFGICWGMESAFHIIDDFTSYKLSPFAIPISHTMVTFNAAVNPFAYALINQRFREKMRGMMCCRSARARAVWESQDIQLTIDNTQPTNTTRPGFID